MFIVVLSALILATMASQSRHKNEDNSEFLFENAKLCGDPFSDPIWIPVLDMCTIECNPQTEYCVENEDLMQQCKPLPVECQKLMQQRKRILIRKTNFVAGVQSTHDARHPAQTQAKIPPPHRAIPRTRVEPRPTTEVEFVEDAEPEVETPTEQEQTASEPEIDAFFGNDSEPETEDAPTTTTTTTTTTTAPLRMFIKKTRSQKQNIRKRSEPKQRRQDFPVLIPISWQDGNVRRFARNKRNELQIALRRVKRI